MTEEDTENVKVSDLWMELVRNRPLRILSFFFIIAFFVIGRYELSDERMDEINNEITNR